MSSRARWFAAAAAAALVLDQGSKAWARAALRPGESRALIEGFWHWHLSYNTGVAFSLATTLGGLGRWLLVAVAVAAAVVCAVMARRSGGRAAALALGLIAGGALGNAVDRALHGQVTDFVLWHLGRHTWPIFNVADAVLLAGVALLLLAPAPRKARAT